MGDCSLEPKHEALKRAGGCILAAFLSVPCLAAPISPTYLFLFADATTGDRSFVASDGKRYYTIAPGADSYGEDFYERPTAQNFQTIDGQFAASEYFGYLDIVQAQAGWDSQFFYVAIDLFNRSKSTDDGVDTVVGLLERYGFRFGMDPDGTGGYLVYADQPEVKNSPNTTYGLVGTITMWDSNDDVGGPGGRSTPNEGGGDGFNSQIIADGVLSSSGQPALWVRISPTDNTVVEFALDYTMLGFTLETMGLLQYLEFEAAKGGTKDPQNYLWNDKYSAAEAGTPYAPGPQPQDIYELDTLQGSFLQSEDVVPEPGTFALLAMGFACVGFAKRRRMRSLSR